MPLPAITAADAKRLTDEGAVLIDIREPDEFRREHVPGAINIPASAFDAAKLPRGAKALVFHCKSGGRTAKHAATIVASCSPSQSYILDGGIEAWKAAGLAVSVNLRQPIDIMRQVQITAGSLVVLGVVLAHYVDPRFIALSAFIGAGLVFSGVTDTCTMAYLLRKAPWNRGWG